MWGPTGQPSLQPPPDAIQEVRRAPPTVTAPQYNLSRLEYGPGGNESGTDHFHLTAFEYLRNTDFNARTFFRQASLIMHQNISAAPLAVPCFSLPSP